MPRPLRPIDDGLIYHVINRGNNRQDVFGKTEDFAAIRRTNTTGLPYGTVLVHSALGHPVWLRNSIWISRFTPRGRPRKIVGNKK